MNTAGSSTARLNNFKGNLFNSGKKNKTSNLETDIIINNIIKARGDDDLNFLDDEGDPRRGGRPYDKKNNNKNKKIRVAKLHKYYREREKLES